MEKKATHTTGPWTATGWEGLVVNDSQGNTLVVCPGHSKAIAKANAALIAAAPELLEALIECVRALQHFRHEGDPSVFMAYAAISKAKGGA